MFISFQFISSRFYYYIILYSASVLFARSQHLFLNPSWLTSGRTSGHQNLFLTQFLYPAICTENPEGTQVIVGSMNMGYISDTARNRTHNLFCPKQELIPLGHSDGLVLIFPGIDNCLLYWIISELTGPESRILQSVATKELIQTCFTKLDNLSVNDLEWNNLLMNAVVTRAPTDLSLS